MTTNSTTNTPPLHIDAVDTPESIRERVLGDPLVKAIDAMVAEQSAEHVRDHDALLIGRCTEMAAAAVLGAHAEIDELKRRLTAYEARNGQPE